MQHLRDIINTNLWFLLTDYDKLEILPRGITRVKEAEVEAGVPDFRWSGDRYLDIYAGMNKQNWMEGRTRRVIWRVVIANEELGPIARGYDLGERRQVVFVSDGKHIFNLRNRRFEDQTAEHSDLVVDLELIETETSKRCLLRASPYVAGGSVGLGLAWMVVRMWRRG